MLAVRYQDTEMDFMACRDRALDEGEAVRVALGDERDVVILSLDRYDRMARAARNAGYLAMIDRSIAQLASGKGQQHDIIETDDDG